MRGRTVMVLLLCTLGSLGFGIGCGLRSPYEGARWDRVARPILTTNAMDGVRRFIEENGWQMQTGSALMIRLAGQMRPLNGLPWRSLTHKRYMAITCDGILYIPLRTFGPESDGVAFNPKTNRFPNEINGFKPLGGGWYVWKQTMAPAGEKEY